MDVGLSRDGARLAAARAGLAAAREADAVGPRGKPEELRLAYLDLLKLCLCDLAGPTTMSVGVGDDGAVVARQLGGTERKMRVAGMDWPLQGLTMSGLYRLDDLQSCVESVVRDEIPGDFIETGTWRGGASIFMRAALDALNDDERTVHVADSFRGFPGAKDGATNADDRLYSGFDFLAVSVDEVQANFARLGCEEGVRFVPGFFEETLPGLADHRWAILRLDGDTYEATRVALRSLYPGLSVGGYVIVDDYGAFDGCRAAVDEFRRENGIVDPLEAVDWSCVRWRREAQPPGEDPPPGPTDVDDERDVAGAPPPDRHRSASVPTVHERALMREREELRNRLARAEEELSQMRLTRLAPLRATVARLRERRRTGRLRR